MSWLADFAESYGVGFQREVYFGIDVGGADRDMPQPGADSIDVHASENQVAGRRMPDHMRGYHSARQFRHPGRATFDEPINPEAGKGCSEPADEYGVLACAAGALVGQNAFGFRPQWALARLAALSVQGGKIVTAIPAPDLQIPHLQMRGFGYTAPVL